MTEDNTKEEKHGKILTITLGLIGGVIVLAIIVAFEFHRHKVYSIGSYISIASITLTIVLFLIKSDKAKINAKKIEVLEKEKLGKEDEKIKKLDDLKELSELSNLKKEFIELRKMFDDTNKELIETNRKLIDIQIQDRKPMLGLDLIKFDKSTSIRIVREYPTMGKVCNNCLSIPVIIKIKNINQRFGVDIKKVEIRQVDFNDEVHSLLLSEEYDICQSIYPNSGLEFSFSCHSDNLGNTHNFQVKISFNEYEYNLIITFSCSARDHQNPIFYNKFYTIHMEKVKGAVALV